MVLGKLPVPGRPTIWITVGQGPIALAVGAGGGGLDILLSSILSLLSPSPWETARYRLKYCLKGPLNPNNERTKRSGLGWSCGAIVLGKRPALGRPTIWIRVGQGPTALTVGAGGGCLDIFTLLYPFSPLSPSLWDTARYRLKYCLKGPLNPKQPTYRYIMKYCLKGPLTTKQPGVGRVVRFPVPGRPTIWITVGQGLTALAVDAGGGCLDIFTPIYPFFSFSLSLEDGPI